MLDQVVFYVLSRVCEQHVVNEGDRCCGAFDVQQDGLDPGRGRAHVRAIGAAATYDGPKHTGSKPLSIPESV